MSQERPSVQPLGLGLGWRREVAELALARDDLGFVEVVAEAVSHRAPLPHSLQMLLDRGVPVVPHGIGLSLGGADRPDAARLAALRDVCTRVDAPIVSEHAAFVRSGGVEAGHLLPVPRTHAALDVLAENVRIAMAELPVPLAIENGAAPFEWPDAELDEAEFLTELAQRTGCLLLLDLANLHVNARNHGFDAVCVLDRLPLERVAYVHTAGGCTRGGILHDTHAHPLWPEVVALVEELTARVAVGGIMLERDDRFPPRVELDHELDAVVSAWSAGSARRVVAPSSCRTRPRTVAVSVGDDVDAQRVPLRRAQSALVAALVSDAPVPPGFRADRVRAAAHALARKRSREARAAWPALAAQFGSSFDERFARWAATAPGGRGGHDDALRFARALPRAERRQLPPDISDAVRARWRRAWSVQLRRRRRRPLRPRRGGRGGPPTGRRP
ncbi:MAG TPA: DUF692 domain-containing protein [Acidimicrobiia bacterium]|nr:DUF692 domain-containing protein [Acidimicrobiia bacterium]